MLNVLNCKASGHVSHGMQGVGGVMMCGIAVLASSGLLVIMGILLSIKFDGNVDQSVAVFVSMCLGAVPAGQLLYELLETTGS